MPRHAPTTDVREANRRWFEYTRHVLGSFAPPLAEEFVRVFEAGRRRHDRASYFAVLADLLAEASHWQGRGAGGPERSTARRADDDTRRVTVCSACLQASCWLGEFYCNDYKAAGVTQKTVAELRALGLESPDYWRPERAQG